MKAIKNKLERATQISAYLFLICVFCGVAYIVSVSIGGLLGGFLGLFAGYFVTLLISGTQPRYPGYSSDDE